MIRLLKYLKKYWWCAILAPSFMILEVAMDLVLISYMANMVDNAIPSGDLNLILKVGLMMISVVAIGVLGGILSGVFTNITSYNFANDLRKDVFKKIMNLSYDQTDKFKTGSLVTRVTNDITQIQNFVSMALRMLIRALSFFILGIIFTLKINSRFGIVIAIVLPLEIIVLLIFMKFAFPLFSIIQKKLDNLNTVVHENVSGARVVKAFCKEEYEEKRFDNANKDYSKTLLKISKIGALLMPVLTLIIYSAQITIYLIGGNSILDFYDNKTPGDMGIKIGEISAAITYMSMICSSLMMIGMTFTNMARAVASAKRINEVLDCKLDIVDGNLDLNSVSEVGTVEFKNVSFKYPGTSKNILENINFKINKGETIAIVGSTGCGKSSLVNLIPRFYDCDSGEVLVNGINIREYKLKDLRNKVAPVLQKSELFAGTMEENIKFGCENASKDEVVLAARIAQALEFIESKPDKFDEYVEEKGASLSGGQKQRLSIARAIIKKPEIIIFDDSTSALDLVTEAKLYQELRANLNDTTVILVAQRIATAKNADRIIVLDNGSVVAIDTHENLLTSCDIYQDIYNSQLKKEGVLDEQ